MSEDGDRRPWWGDYDLAEGEAAKWTIGPLSLWLLRGSTEWRLAHEWQAGQENTAWSVEKPAEFPENGAGAERFALEETGSVVHLRPLTADRAVVARPKTAFRVLPGQKARVFLSSPLWVEITLGERRTLLRGLAARRLSDTWFGATTRDGELCYALKTSARTDLEDMPRAAYRLLTPVVIENRAPDSVQIERLNVPVPFLSIFETESGEAWSEEVRMLRSETGDLAELDVRPGPPREADGATILSSPRLVAEEGHLFRAFGSLLGFAD